MGLPDGLSGHSQEASGYSRYLKRKEVQLICRIPTWEWTVTWLSDSPNWVRQGCYLVVSPNWVWQVCDLLSELTRTNWWQLRWTHCVSWRLSLDCLGTTPRILGSTCKAFNFWLCNPRVSGRGGSGPGRPWGMARECTWITAREEACSEGGGGVPDIPILEQLPLTINWPVRRSFGCSSWEWEFV